MTDSRHALILLLALVLALILLRLGFNGERDFENAALGTMTVSYQGKDSNGTPIHTIKQRENEVESMRKSVAGDSAIFFLGNSQTHSINQKNTGEVVYPELISKSYLNHPVLVNSLPNANLQEFFTLLNWWNNSISIKKVVIPVFMDDLREDGLRRDFMSGLTRENYFLPKSDAPLITDLNGQLQAFLPKEATPKKGSAASATPQDRVEQAINEWLSERSQTWRNRPNARGDLFMKLYQLRNQAFGIKATSKRKMIPARMNRNLQALDMLIGFTSENDIDVLLYIPPIRQDVEIPYDLNEYNTFISDMEQLASNQKHVHFRNWEDIIPARLWGVKASTNGSDEPELDFMHFQFAGHEILADSILNALSR